MPCFLVILGCRKTKCLALLQIILNIFLFRYCKVEESSSSEYEKLCVVSRIVGDNSTGYQGIFMFVIHSSGLQSYLCNVEVGGFYFLRTVAIVLRKIYMNSNMTIKQLFFKQMSFLNAMEVLKLK